MSYFFSYLLLRAVVFPFSLLSYAQLHKVGKWLGNVVYFLLPRFRKIAFSNLACASLNLNEKEIKKLAQASFQNLMITCLEYGKLSKEQNIEKIAKCVNPEQAQELVDQGKGVIFFCGHQANWEILFLEGTSRMPGVAIGRPIKNRFLYNWILKMRQKFGGKIVTPKEAIKEGLRALKKGAFLGIVGDQGMPSGEFSSPFFGREAWTSPLPALLAYRTGSPLFVATTKRVDGKYLIHYSEPIWPNQEAEAETEIRRLMEKALELFEASIKETPSQWLWQHNRWKQQSPGALKRRFRHDTIAILLPEEGVVSLDLFREIYPTELITVHKTLPKDYRSKLVFNFTGKKNLHRHFKSALHIAHLSPQHFNAQMLKSLVQEKE